MVGILTHEQKQLAFRLRGRGWRLVDITREMGCSAPMVGLMVRAGRFTNGVPDEWEPRPGCMGMPIVRRSWWVSGTVSRWRESRDGSGVHPRRSAARSTPTAGGRPTRHGALTSEHATRPDVPRSASSAPDGCTTRSRVVCSSCGRPTRSLAAYRWRSPMIRRCG